jgi:hypothetical protein
MHGHRTLLPAACPQSKAPKRTPQPSARSVLNWGQATLLSQAPSGRHTDRVRKPGERSNLPGSVGDRDAGAKPLRADPRCGTRPPSECSTAYPDNLDCPVITDQSVWLGAVGQRLERRSDDGQMIFEAL